MLHTGPPTKKVGTNEGYRLKTVEVLEDAYRLLMSSEEQRHDRESRSRTRRKSMDGKRATDREL